MNKNIFSTETEFEQLHNLMLAFLWSILGVAELYQRAAAFAVHQ